MDSGEGGHALGPIRRCELRAKLEKEKPECTLWSLPNRPATTPGCGGHHPQAHNREYGWDGVEWELPKLERSVIHLHLRGPGDFYLEMVIHAGWRWTTTTGIEKVIPENEVGNEARIL